MFILDERLKKDTIDCGSWQLCKLLLMNTRTYPWFILVPRREGVTEIHHLNEEDRLQFWKNHSGCRSGWRGISFSPSSMSLHWEISSVSFIFTMSAAAKVTPPGPVPSGDMRRRCPMPTTRRRRLSLRFKKHFRNSLLCEILRVTGNMLPIDRLLDYDRATA